MNGPTAEDPVTTIGSGRLEQRGLAAPATRGLAISTPSAPTHERRIRITVAPMKEVSAPYGVDLSPFTCLCDHMETDRVRSVRQAALSSMTLDGRSGDRNPIDSENQRISAISAT